MNAIYVHTSEDVREHVKECIDAEEFVMQYTSDVKPPNLSYCPFCGMRIYVREWENSSTDPWD